MSLEKPYRLKDGKQSLTYSRETFETRRDKWREVRDVVNYLRPKFTPRLVDEFMRTNYFLQPRAVEIILQRCDDQPVNNPSLIHKAVLSGKIQVVSMDDNDQLTTIN